jgi:hypothetical protein
MEPEWVSNIYQEYIQYDLATNSYYIKFDKLWELSPQLYRKYLGGNRGIHETNEIT